MGRHAIIVIKNEKNEYLQYFDDRWNSFLFLNCKMKDRMDIDSISNKLEEALGVKKEEANLLFVDERVHKKFSESAKKEKEYEHYFYKAELLNTIEEMNQKEFIKSDYQYRWFSYEELAKDKRIQQVNSDIVGFIKELKI